MATTNFNSILLELARKLKDARTSAAASDDTGKRYTSTILSLYINRAVRDMLIEFLLKNGPKAFTETFPAYVKTGSGIVLSSGVGAKPSDCLTVIDLRSSSAKFERIPQNIVSDVVAGVDGLISPSASMPVFYEEGANFYTLGITSGTVYPRYIVTPTDIVVSVVVPGSGKWRTAGGGSFTVATNTLSGVTMSTPFASGDENKKIMFYDSLGAKVYFAYISSVVSGTSVVVYGDGLPGTDITGDITSVLVADNDSSDLKLNAYWYGEVIDRAIKYANEDARSFAE